MNQLKVEYVDHMGTDLTAVNSARISYGNTKDELDDKDKKLIKYLAKHSHFSPFEHMQLSVVIHCPLFIRSQIHRHRTFSYNEISRRYTAENLEFYEPTQFRKQHNSSKQCSAEDLDEEANTKAQIKMQFIHKKALDSYNELLDLGVSREMARAVLPQSLMTSFYMSGNLRNFVAFLKLRLDGHAQEEARVIAGQIKDIILEKFPHCAKELIDEV